VSDETRFVVLDSSVGVKWIKPESGREEARALLAEHLEGRLQIVVASLFLHEVVAVAVRHDGPDLAQRVWVNLQLAGLTVVELNEAIARAAFDQCRLLRCSFYDALAPALAERLGAPLYSADARAHGQVAEVVIVG
jgi:predicted nucleic acid-binding protein